MGKEESVSFRNVTPERLCVFIQSMHTQRALIRALGSQRKSNKKKAPEVSRGSGGEIEEDLKGREWEGRFHQKTVYGCMEVSVNKNVIKMISS